MTQTLQAREKQELQGENTRPGPTFRPEVDILERKDGYVIIADLPGANESSVDVRFDKGTLTLDARLATFPEEGWRPLHAEYACGTYHRSFRLSDDIDADGVSATMENGVLQLDLPKSAERQPRSIPVHAS